MTTHGQLISDEDPSHEKVYIGFDRYFNSPTMIKIKDVEAFSMYMTKMYCLLRNQCRYLVAFVPKDQVAVSDRRQLIQLKWTSFQTRTLEDNHELPAHGYQPNRSTDMNVPISKTATTDEYVKYSCEKHPLIITLLAKSDGAMQYQNNGSLLNALETYHTIVTFT